MITVTNKQIRDSVQALTQLATLRLAPQPGLKVARALKAALNACDANVAAERKVLAAHMIEAAQSEAPALSLDAAINMGHIEDVDALKSALDEHNATTTELDIQQIDIRDIGDAPLPLTLLLALDWLIVEPAPPPAEENTGA